MDENNKVGISYIIASKDKERFGAFIGATLKLSETDEIICEKGETMAKAYNAGISKSINKIKCFIHDDVEILDMERLRGDIIKNCRDDTGIVGIIGTINKDVFPWWDPKVDCCGNVLDERIGLINFDGGDCECALLDGLLLATAQNIEFDETYKGFHLYDMDICRQMIAKGLKNWCLGNGASLVKHHTNGPLDTKELGEDWESNLKTYKDKWAKKTRISGNERKTVKVAISIPNEGHTLPEAYDNRMLWAIHMGIIQEKSQREPVTKDGAIFEFHHFTAGRLLTPAAREALPDKALASGMDYILMIDDDMIIPLDMFERLYDHGVDVVAPLAFTRNAPHYAVIYEVEKGYDPVGKTDYFVNHYARNYPENELVRCDAVGFGAALIKVDILRRMKKPYFMSTCGTGEDILFCYNAQQQAGAKVYMDTSVKLGHLSDR